jgi:uncharacterized repeat protein (TIGR01451 family)
MREPSFSTLKLLLIMLLLGMLGSTAVVPASRAQSATETPTTPPPAGPLRISGVQPTSVVNDVDVEIVVTGGGFRNGAVVVLNGFGGLLTTFVSESVLRAFVPAGVPADYYAVQVVNPDAATAELARGLSVIAPAAPDATPDASRTPEPTAFVRPLLVVASYGASAPLITPGQNLDFEMTLTNAGQATATNVLATFVSGDFVPRDTGGVRALGTLAPGEANRFWQPLFATADLRGKTTAVLQVNATYTDVNGQSYETTFELTFPVVPTAGEGAAATATPTPTPTVTPTAGPRLRPQLLVTSNETDPAKLEPGRQFVLTITVANEGEANARNVSMILGGGSTSGGSSDGTPEAGGLSGAGGEFSQFAPIGSSNVSRLGDLAVGQSKQAAQQLVVNTSTKPGAYPLKVSFVYTDNAGGNFVDDQVITLLVFQEPQVEMGFYTPPGPFFVGQPGGLPLQLVNTGRSSAVFGNYTVNAPEGELSNNTVFVGALDPGGFFPLDALIIPAAAGPLDLELSVSYTDDFNQPASIDQTVTIEVMEGEDMMPEDPGMDPGLGPEMGPDGGGGLPDGGAPESLAQKVWRFILGLFGFSSAPPGGQAPEGMPDMEQLPPEFEGGG